MTRGLRIVLVAGLLVGTAAACGSGSGFADGSQVVVLHMANMSFKPSLVSVHVGDTVTFRFVNDDTIVHEAVVGDDARQRAHAAMMGAMAPASTGAPSSTTTSTVAPAHGMSRAAYKHPGMNDPNAVSVAPGQTGDVVITFGKVAQWLIGCHEPGHYEAGMSAVIDIAA
jgi:uncharacterized cupredoxin-like copper-binding protein